MYHEHEVSLDPTFHWLTRASNITIPSSVFQSIVSGNTAHSPANINTLKWDLNV